MAIYSQDQYRMIVYDLLMRGDKKGAARLLWPWIKQNEQSDKIWHALEENPYLAIMGHGSASKTFTCSQWFLLDWWTAPDETALAITSDTSDSMGRRVWSDIKILFTKARVKMPGELIDSRRLIVHSKTDHKNAVAGITAESDNAQSKIQGLHTKRIRVLIDEADNEKSNSIWSALANLQTSGDLRVCALANPENRFSYFGQHVEPENGWSSVNPECDFKWNSKKSWTVLRLDGLQSPNIVSKEDKYPFLLTNENLDKIIDKHGTNSLEWWKYVRAWYSPEDASNIVFPLDLIEKSRKNPIVWYSSVQAISACDPAFEGGDKCIQYFGLFGRLASNPNKTALVVTKRIHVKRKDLEKEVHIDIADQVIQNCKDNGVSPRYFCHDATGNASFMASYIKTVWSPEILAVEFAQSCSDKKIFQEDSKVASERFDRFVTELWFAARDWMKAGLVHIQECDPDLSVQLGARKYALKGKGIASIESKKEMKGRGLRSPDDGDAFCLLVHCLRHRANVALPSVTNKEVKHDPLKRFRGHSYKMDYGIKEPDQP